MDIVAIFDQNINLLVLLQINGQESDCSVYVMVVWNRPMVDYLQQLEVWDM